MERSSESWFAVHVGARVSAQNSGQGLKDAHHIGNCAIPRRVAMETLRHPSHEISIKKTLHTYLAMNNSEEFP